MVRLNHLTFGHDRIFFIKFCHDHYCMTGICAFLLKEVSILGKKAAILGFGTVGQGIYEGINVLIVRVY